MDTDTDRARTNEAKTALDDAYTDVYGATSEPDDAPPVNHRHTFCMPSADAIADAIMRRSNTGIGA